LQFGDIGQIEGHKKKFAPSMQVSGGMGLPLRIALPIFAVVAAVFIGVMGYFIKQGLGNNGTALGYGAAPAEQGDARMQATAAPVAVVTDPPGTFTVPQTGTGPAQPPGQAPDADAGAVGAAAPAGAPLPGQAVGGGGPPAPVMQELTELRARLKANPNDLAALVALSDMYFDAGKFDQAIGFYTRALALDPTNPDVRTDYATALHQTGHDIESLKQLDTVLADRPKFLQALFNRGVVLRAIGLRTDAVAAFHAFIAAAPNDPRVADAKSNIQELGG
jgi:tetratricopeptide (TPR) repeat protein